MFNLPDTLPPLRDYQSYCYAKRLEKRNNQIICIPTGGGKGNILVRQLLDNIKKAESTLVIVPTEELLINLEKRIKKCAPLYYPIINFVSGKRKKNFDSPYMIITYPTLYKNLDNLQFNYQHVIGDEVHLSSCITWLACLQRLSDAEHTGYTATPGRLDNRPLDFVYDEINLCPYSVREMIDLGYLADFEIYGLPIDGFKEAYAERDRSVDQDGLAFQQKYLTNNKVTEQIYTNWAECSYNKKTIGFASGQLHAEYLTELFNSKFSEKRFAFMHNNMAYKERAEILQAFSDNSLLGVFNINMLCMGVDVPDAVSVLLCRATASDNMHRQQMGRIMRVKPSGEKGLIIDCVGNTAEHGSPTFPKEYSLSSNPDDKVSNPLIICPCCTIPLAARSKIIKDIQSYLSSNRLSTHLYKVDPPKEKTIKSHYGDRTFTTYQTVLRCDNCHNLFNRRIEIESTVKEVNPRELKEVNTLGSLVRVDADELDEYILSNKLLNIIGNEQLTSQTKRSRILRSKEDPQSKLQALVRSGETIDTAKILVGIID